MVAKAPSRAPTKGAAPADAVDEDDDDAPPMIDAPSPDDAVIAVAGVAHTLIPQSSAPDASCEPHAENTRDVTGACSESGARTGGMRESMQFVRNEVAVMKFDIGDASSGTASTTNR